MSETNHINQSSSSNTYSSGIGWFYKLFFAGVIIIIALLRLINLTTAGLTTTEADTLARFAANLPENLSDVFYNMPWINFCPAIIMRLCTMCGDPPIYGRFIIVAIGIWSVFLVGSIERKNQTFASGLLAIIFAGLSSLWIFSSQEMILTGIIVWVVLILQWAFSLVIVKQTWLNVFIYLFIALICVTVSQALNVIIILHVIWLYFVCHKRSTEKSINLRKWVVSAGGLCIALLLLFLRNELQIKTPSVHIIYEWLRIIWITFAKVTGADGLKAAYSHLRLDIIMTVIFCCIGLISALTSFIKRKGSARIWLTLLLSVPLVLLLTGGIHNEFSFIWPFTVLLIADGFYVLSVSVLLFSKRFGGKTSLIIKLAYGIFVTAVFFLFFFGQYVYYLNMTENRIERDVSQPVKFLESVVDKNDKMIFVSDKDARNWFRTRYYLYDFLTNCTRASFEHVNQIEWSTNFPGYLPGTNTALWTIGYNTDSNKLCKLGYKVDDFPFALPINYIILSSQWNTITYLDFLRKAVAAAPDNRNIARKLLNWYRENDAPLLQDSLIYGWAYSDISKMPDIPGIKLYKRAAANNVLYAWNKLNVSNYNSTNFHEFNKYANAVNKIGIDKVRAIYIYRLYAESALKNTNLVMAIRAMESAKQIDAEDPYLCQLAAKIETYNPSPDYNRIIKLNNKAIELYEKKYNKKYIEAIFLNMISYRNSSNYNDAFAYGHSLLNYFYDEYKMPVSVQTNEAPNGSLERERWKQGRLSWLGRCNSFIANLLVRTGDYRKAILWEMKNLDPCNSEARRTRSRERLANMYVHSGGVNEALEQFTVLANAATSMAKRISWMLEGTQLYVTLGDTVSTHERWKEIEKEMQKLPLEERWIWSKDQRCRRIVKYLGNRMHMDIRNPIIIALTKRAEKEKNMKEAAWLYVQIAELYRCKLQYNKVNENYNLAIRTAHDYYDAYLAKGIYQYRMQRYAKAEITFTNMLGVAIKNNNVNLPSNDWRYIILDLLYKKGKPPVIQSTIDGINAVKPYFSDAAEYNNYLGNTYECYNNYISATNEFVLGINTNSLFIPNYLDLGYLICKRSDSEGAGAVIDKIMSLDLSSEEKQRFESDWRFIILHYVSVRPYNIKE